MTELVGWLDAVASMEPHAGTATTPCLERKFAP